MLNVRFYGFYEVIQVSTWKHDIKVQYLYNISLCYHLVKGLIFSLYHKLYTYKHRFKLLLKVHRMVKTCWQSLFHYLEDWQKVRKRIIQPSLWTGFSVMSRLPLTAKCVKLPSQIIKYQFTLWRPEIPLMSLAE